MIHNRCQRGLLCLLMALAAASLASADNAKTKLRRTPGPKITNQYVVVFHDGVRAAEVAEALIARHGGAARRTFRHALSGAVAVGLTEAEAAALAQNPIVRWVEEDAIVGIHEAGIDDPAGAWGLDRIDQPTPALDRQYRYDFTGAGVTAYILDTGIRTTHVEFGGRAVWGANFIDSYNGDCHYHGTHVAGTVGSTHYGVAKAVRLVAVKVLGCDGFGTVSSVIAGIDWVTANAIQPAVANMSLGSSGSDAFDVAVENSSAAGIPYTVSAGNGGGSNACDWSPAGATSALTVGSTSGTREQPRTWDRVSSISNVGPCVDIFAPGEEILAPVASSDANIGEFSGTSMAAPHVTGAVALLREEFPLYNVQQLQDELRRRALVGYVRGLSGASTPNLLLQTRVFDDPLLLVGADGPYPIFSGSGQGTITTIPGQIDCGLTCSAVFSRGASVDVVATPAAGSYFVGWAGACTGTGPCSVTMDRSMSVRARFNTVVSKLTARAGTYFGSPGSGTVISSPAGIECGAQGQDCEETYADGTMVTLTGIPEPDSYLGGWGQDCAFDSPLQCVVRMDSARSVLGAFGQYPVRLAVAHTGCGSGTVTIEPSGQRCNGNCEAYFHSGVPVSLRATPDQGSTFSGWSGDCTGAGDCAFSTTRAQPHTAVTALFTGSHLGTVADFYSLPPCRLVDTRSTTRPVAGERRTYALAGACGIPANAKAVSLNVTAIAGAGAGALRVVPGDITSDTSVVSFSSGRVRAAATVIALDCNGQLAVEVVAAPGSTADFVLDVSGYFR